MSTADTPPSERSGRYGLGAARLLWILVAGITLALVIAGVRGLLEQFMVSADPRALEDLDLTPVSYAVYLTGLNLIVVVAHFVIGSIVYVRRTADWLALLAAFALVTNGALITLSLMHAQGSASPGLIALVDLVTSTGLISGIVLLYVFPDGRFVPGWTRYLSLAWALVVVVSVFFSDSPLSLTSWPLAVQVLVLMVWSGAGVIAQITRYANASSPAQKQQTKWAILGLSLAAMGPFGYFLPSLVLPFIHIPEVPNILYQRVGPAFFTNTLLYQIASWTIFTFVLLIFPLSFVIAILRYRLWDIDLIINRTLVYAALTGSLAVVYFASVVIVGRLFPFQNSQFAVLTSTLAIAALFNPLRQRIQRLIDRRFYRRKYNIEQILAAFSASIREEVDLADLSQTLLTVVGDTMQPESVSLWLKNPKERSEE